VNQVVPLDFMSVALLMSYQKQKKAI
jgi:hypothetical protein